MIYLTLTKMFALHTDLSDIMNKLLVITVLVTLLGLSAQGLRLPRQAEEGTPKEPVADVAEADGEQGTLEKLTSAVKSYYETSISTATSWLASINGMKLKEKAKNALIDTGIAVSTYSGILQDQIYHILYQQ
uniref:Apolipoprotein C-II n=1 Tax=Hucho hucho TaxID=62062 RepID=A0A4W5PVE8_9TELE